MASGRNVHRSVKTWYLNTAHPGHPVPLWALPLPRDLLTSKKGRMVSNFQKLKQTPAFANIKFCFTAKWTINFQDLEQNFNSTPSYRCCGHKDCTVYFALENSLKLFFLKKKKRVAWKFDLVLRKISPEAMQLLSLQRHFPSLPGESPTQPGSPQR